MKNKIEIEMKHEMDNVERKKCSDKMNWKESENSRCPRSYYQLPSMFLVFKAKSVWEWSQECAQK